jgi:hypothetical protein
VTITATAGAGGQITPTGSVPVAVGGSQSFAITPEAGFRVSDVQVDGVSVGAVSGYTFSEVTADHTIAAAFSAETVTITATAGADGQISPAGSVPVAVGGSQTFTMAPNPGYLIDDVQVDGISIGAVSVYTFSDVTTQHTIGVQFRGAPMPPIADAGPDQLVDQQTVVRLSGSNSIDLDDGIAAFQWVQTEGVPVEIAGSSEAESTFVTPAVGSGGEALVFALHATDYSGLTGTDTCIVNVTWANQPPAAAAGENQSVIPGDTVVLDGSGSTDPEAGTLTFSWRQVEGSPVFLADPHAAQTSFLAPDIPPEGETLRFELTVTDAAGLKSRDSCLVTVVSENVPPLAATGSDQIVPGGTQVTLGGTGSYDLDDGIALFLWKQLSGPPVILSDSTAVAPGFTAPPAPPAPGLEALSFMLTVTDEKGLKGSDNCAVWVKEDNPPPEEVGESVFLDFEALADHNQEDIALVAPDFGGLDWTRPEMPGTPNDLGHWTIMADGSTLAAHSGSTWIQANAVDIRGIDRDQVSDFAQITRLNNRYFRFERMTLRTKYADNSGRDKNGDGIDDRWLSQVDVCFRDIDGNEVRHTVHFIQDAWVDLTAADVPGLDALGPLESISFWGDAEKSAGGGDSFGLDDLSLRLP